MSKLDPKEWDPPEYLPKGDQQFLINRASTMHKIQEAAYLQMGQILLQVREKFKKDSKLDGWWQRWVEEATPLNYKLAVRLINIAKAAQSVPGFVDLTSKCSQSCAALVALLPSKTRRELVSSVLDNGLELIARDVKSIRAQPEVQLQQVEEEVVSIQTAISRLALTLATTRDSSVRSEATQETKRQQSRLELAVEKLSEARAKVNSLEKERSTQDLLVAQINAQLRNKELQLEELSQDPIAKRKRAVAKTVVEATNGLDLLLQSLDKLEVDKDDIGEEALSTIERKMAQVKLKLLEVKVGTL